MPTPLPDDATVDLTSPGPDEVALLSRGVLTAVTPDSGLTGTQRLLVGSIVSSMTGYPATFDGAPLDPAGFGAALARRTLDFRTRIVQVMVLLALVVRPLPHELTTRIAAYARELGVEEGMLEVADRFADGSLGLAAVDFERNGYTADWHAEDARVLHTSRALATAWEEASSDPALAEQWTSLEQLAPDTLGRRITDFYRARGFAYPGLPGSAPPLLAQHDWVHVVADYGTTVESELEVFAFIARANDDMRAFSLLAMVVSCSRPATCGPGPGCSSTRPGTCRSRAWPSGWPTPCAGVRCATAASTSCAPTGSNWHRCRSTRSVPGSASPRSRRMPWRPARSARGSRAGSAPSRRTPDGRRPTPRAGPTTRSGPRSPPTDPIHPVGPRTEGAADSVVVVLMTTI